MQNTKLITILAAAVLAGCASHTSEKATGISNVQTAPSESRPGSKAQSTSSTHAAYKTELANRISEVNASKIYGGRPQALLRSVIVVKYHVDANGNVARTEIMRTNHDGETEATALATLRKAAPFPKPATHLLQRGRVEIVETWLFNKDGRFQLRTVAQPQMGE
jgi:protein TonB